MAARIVEARVVTNIIRKKPYILTVIMMMVSIAKCPPKS